MEYSAYIHETPSKPPNKHVRVTRDRYRVRKLYLRQPASSDRNPRQRMRSSLPPNSADRDRERESASQPRSEPQNQAEQKHGSLQIPSTRALPLIFRPKQQFDRCTSTRTLSLVFSKFPNSHKQKNLGTPLLIPPAWQEKPAGTRRGRATAPPPNTTKIHRLCPPPRAIHESSPLPRRPPTLNSRAKTIAVRP